MPSSVRRLFTNTTLLLAARMVNAFNLKTTKIVIKGMRNSRTPNCQTSPLQDFFISALFLSHMFNGLSVSHISMTFNHATA